MSAESAGPPVRIGALPTVSARIMPAAIAALPRDAPAPPLKIVTGENLVLLEQLRLGVLDLVVGRLAEPEQMTGFFFEHLYSEQVDLRGAARPSAAAPARTFRALRELPDADADAAARSSGRSWSASSSPTASPRPPVEIETVSDSFGRAFVRAERRDLDHLRGRRRRRPRRRPPCRPAARHERHRAPVGLTMRTDARTQPELERIMLAVRHAARAAGV